jgi:copper chaperone CopZ
MKKVILLGIIALFSSNLSAQSQDTVMIVNGVCGMCEKVIEKAAKIDGVSKADWDENTKILTLQYQAEKVNLEQISKAVAASGYDTEYLTAPDSAYQALHGCCHYRDPKVVENHTNKK